MSEKKLRGYRRNDRGNSGAHASNPSIDDGIRSDVVEPGSVFFTGKEENPTREKGKLRPLVQLLEVEGLYKASKKSNKDPDMETIRMQVSALPSVYQDEPVRITTEPPDPIDPYEEDIEDDTDEYCNSMELNF